MRSGGREVRRGWFVGSTGGADLKKGRLLLVFSCSPGDELRSGEGREGGEVCCRLTGLPAEL